MGRIAKILSSTKTTINGIKNAIIKVTPYGSDNVSAELFSAPGDASLPLDIDSVFIVDKQKTGGFSVVGSADINRPEVAEPGEKYIYSRDTDGNKVADIHLKNDGTIIATNAGGSIELKPDGTLNVNANTSINMVAPAINLTGTVVITGTLVVTSTLAATSIATTGDVVANGKSLITHLHPSVGVPPNTGPPV